MNTNLILDVITAGFISITAIIFFYYIIKYGLKVRKAGKYLEGLNIDNIDVSSPLMQSYQSLLGKKMCTSEYANDIINIDSLAKEYRIKLSVISAVPNILTSIGILGTFVGLSIAITSFDSQSAESIRSSIQVLLGGMGTAFYTSVVGMFCSAVFLMIKKHWINKLNWRIDKVCELLDAKYHKSADDLIIASFSHTTEDGYTVTPQELILSVKEGIRDMQTSLARLSTDLCDSIGNAMDESFQNKLVPIIKELSEKLENPAQAITDSLMTEFRNICNDFSENLTKGVNDQMDDLLERFIDASNAINTLPETIELVNISLKETTNKTTNAYNSLLESTTQQIENITDISNTLCKSLEEVQNVLSNMSDIHSKLDYLPQVIAEAKDAIKSASSKIETAIDGINKSIQNADNLNEETRSKIEDYLTSVSLIQAGLKDMFAEISIGLNQYSSTAREGLQKMLDPFTTSVTEASEQMANSITPLNDTVNDLSEFAESIHNLLENLNKTLKPLEKSIKEILESRA